MKLVIDIPEEEYKRVMDGKWYGNGLADYIENGTPLPKGHGRLVDADAITKDLNTLQDSFAIAMDRTGGFVGITCTAPTIIEADKGGEQE